MSETHKFVQLLSPAELWLALSDSFSSGELAKLCNSCGISYDGIRTKSLPPEKLVADLVEEFYEIESSAGRIMKALKKANSDLLSRFARTDPSEIRSLLKSPEETLKIAGVGRLLFTLAVDPRQKVNALVPELISQLEKIAPEEDFLFTPPPESHVPRSKTKGLEEEISKLRSRLEMVQGRLKRLQKENLDLSRERDLWQNEKKELERKMLNLTQKIEDLKFDQEKEERLNSQIKKIERENRKLRYQLGNLSPQQDKRGIEEAIGAALAGLQSEVNLTKAALGEEKASLQVLAREIKGIREGITKLKNLIEASQVGKGRGKSDRKRVGIFVDVQNMFYAAKQFNGRLDFQKLLNSALRGRRLVVAKAYVVQNPESDLSGFVSMLQQLSYQVKRKDLRLRSDGSAKGDWDMGMAIDIISLADKLDVVVLVSGDGDFVDLVNLLKTMGPKVEVFSFPHNTARDLMEVVDEYFPITEALLMGSEAPLRGSI